MNSDKITIPLKAYNQLLKKFPALASQITEQLKQRAIKEVRYPKLQRIRIGLLRIFGYGDQTIDPVFNLKVGTPLNSRRRTRAMKLQKIYGFIRFMWTKSGLEKKNCKYKSSRNNSLREYMNLSNYLILNVSQDYSEINISFFNKQQSSQNEPPDHQITFYSKESSDGKRQTHFTFPKLTEMSSHELQNLLDNQKDNINVIYTKIISYANQLSEKKNQQFEDM